MRRFLSRIYHSQKIRRVVRSVARLPIRTLRFFARRCKRIVSRIFVLFCRKFNIYKKGHISAADLFWQQFRGGKLDRMDLAVRYMACEELISANEGIGVEFYRKIQKLRPNEGDQDCVGRFKTLIEKVREKGFAPIQLDKNNSILDGAHRLTIGIYNTVQGNAWQELPFLRRPYAGYGDYTLDYFWNAGFSRDEIMLLNKTFEDITKALTKSFTAIIWSPAMPFFGEITEDMAMLCDRVIQTRVIEFSDENQYKAMVNLLYRLDDITQYGVNKKLEYMEGYAPLLGLIEFTVRDPNMGIKASTGTPYSFELERIKQIIRNRYKGKIENYHWDIIIHLVDNFEREAYEKDLLRLKEISLTEFFTKIEGLKYAVRMLTSDSMAKAFPNEIMPGHDVDILVADADFDCIKGEALVAIGEICDCFPTFTSAFVEKYGGKAIEMHVRQCNKLIFSFDITTVIPHVWADKFFDPAGFWEHCLDSTVERRGIKTLAVPDEMCFRATAHLQNKRKKYHLDYIRDNLTDDNLAYMRKNLKPVKKIEGMLSLG